MLEIIKKALRSRSSFFKRVPSHSFKKLTLFPSFLFFSD